MNDEMPHDDQLRELYRKLPADEPRAELDDAILAAARKRARETARLNVLRRVRWSVSLAAAAGLVLTLTLNRLTSEPELKRADVSAVQLTEHAQPASAPASAPVSSPASAPPPVPAPETAPAPATAPAAPTLDALKDRDARRESTQAAVASKEKAESDAVPDRKPESQPLGKDIAAGSARAKADFAAPVARTESKKQSAAEAQALAPDASARLGAARAPEDNRGHTGERAPQSPPTDVLSNLRSLGYIGGGEEAPAPPPPPSGSGTANDAPAPQAEDAPCKANEAESSDEGVAACEAAPQEPPAPQEPWPFGLEPGLAPEEACRRVSEALRQDCRFLAGLVDMPITSAVRIDRGRLAGRTASKLTMSLQRGKLWSVILEFRSPDGSVVAQETFLAPEPVWAPAPVPAPVPKH